MSEIVKDKFEEKPAKTRSGMSMLVLSIILYLLDCAAIAVGAMLIAASSGINSPLPPGASSGANPFGVFLLVAGILYSMVGWIFFMGLKIVKPNEALVLTLFGKYYGTLKQDGFYYVNPFVSAVNPAADYSGASSGALEKQGASIGNVLSGAATLDAAASQPFSSRGKKISLKVSTLNNDRQKINDQLGNPIIIGIVVIWRVVNPTKAVFNTDNYKEFLSIQCDSALRNIVRLYPYDTYGDDNEKTLRGSSLEIAIKLKEEIQSKVEIGGIEIIEARITQLSYAPEIAAAMLQRQQASAVIDARQMIVEGAVGMVELALAKLGENNIVTLDDERKAAMVSNLMVVLCGSRDAQPVVNSGTIY